MPYFFFSALHALFNTFNYAMIIPILNAMFSEGFTFQPIYDMPALSFKGEALQQWLNYIYTMIFGTEWRITNVLMLLAVILVAMNLLSNLFRYLGGYTVESMRVSTVQRMRNAMETALAQRAEAEAAKTRCERESQEKNKDILNM